MVPGTGLYNPRESLRSLLNFTGILSNECLPQRIELHIDNVFLLFNTDLELIIKYVYKRINTTVEKRCIQYSEYMSKHRTHN